MDEFAEYRRRLRTPHKPHHGRYMSPLAWRVLWVAIIFAAVRFLPDLDMAGVPNSDAVAATPAAVNVRFTLCAQQYQSNCVVDGDTIHFNSTRIRIEDIDAPETHEYKCASELALGEQATQRLLELLNAGPFQIVYSGGRDIDKYGRELRVIERNGQSLGGILVSEGLARIWDGARHPWCT